MTALSVGVTLVYSVGAEELTKENMVSGVRANLAAYDTIELSGEGPVTTKLMLGESVSQLGDSLVFDGIRIKAPADLKGRDFVWYFNAPAAWANWFIIPVSGDFEGGFKNWMNADRIYKNHDKPAQAHRQRVLQTLDGSYFEAGREYILWFRRVAEDATQEHEVRLVLDFAIRTGDKDWDNETVEQALKLVPAPAADQVVHLGSRGGRVLLDESLFDPRDASARIDDVLFDIRNTSRSRSGFFVTIETTFPPCRRSPALQEIIAKYGPPDISIPDSETRRLAPQEANSKDKSTDNLVLHYYDYFAFETSADDALGRVQRVRTHASDFGQFRVPKEGFFMRQAALKNLSVFLKDGKEVGRIYYFLEGGKKPVVIHEPPVGRYSLDESTTLVNEAPGKWQWLTFRNSKISRRVPLESHMMHGQAEGYYPDGKHVFKANYQNGRLHGEVIEFNESGAVSKKSLYQNGRQIISDGAKN